MYNEMCQQNKTKHTHIHSPMYTYEPISAHIFASLLNVEPFQYEIRVGRRACVRMFFENFRTVPQRNGTKKIIFTI